jgi:hypothetical protein
MSAARMVEAPASRAATRWGRWIGAGIGTVIFGALVACFVTASVNESAKIDKMVAIADGIPAADWKVTRVSDPRPPSGASRSTSPATAYSGTGRRRNLWTWTSSWHPPAMTWSRLT